MQHITDLEARDGRRMMVFALDDTEPALKQPLGSLDLLDAWWGFNGEWYEPPINFDDLTKLLRANAHHESAINCMCVTVMQGYRPGRKKVISRHAMEAITFDYIYTGNWYAQAIRNRRDNITELRHLHARTLRKRRDGRYLQIVGAQQVTFQPGEVIHGMKYAPESGLYGLPQYLGALQSLLLNEAGTLFRRRFYLNGAHMGFILFSVSEDVDEEDVKDLKKKIADTKGVGNFKSLFLHMDGEGKVELIPVGDFAKDDFEKIKTLSRDDIISSHRVPPQILAVLTDNKQPAPGDLDKVVNLYNSNVVTPLQLDLTEEINQYLPVHQRIAFDPYALPGTAAPDAPVQEPRP